MSSADQTPGVSRNPFQGVLERARRRMLRFFSPSSMQGPRLLMADKVFAFLSLLTIIAGIVLTLIRTTSGEQAVSRQGEAVLDPGILHRQQVVELTGEWLCIEDADVTPEMADALPAARWQVISLPESSLSHLIPLDGLVHEQGMTYRLRIRLPDTGLTWGIRTKGAGLRQRIYVNGREIKETYGSAAWFSAADQVSDDGFALCEVSGNEMDMLVQLHGDPFELSTFMISVGTGRSVLWDRMGKIILDSFIACSYLILFLYVLAQTAYPGTRGRMERAMVPYSLYLLSICISFMTRSESLFLFVFPHIPIPLFHGIQQIADIATCAFLLRYVRLLTNRSLRLSESLIVPCAGVLVAGLVLLHNDWLNALARFLFIAFGAMLLLMAWRHLLRNMRQIEHGGWLIVVGLASSSFMFVSTLLSDISLHFADLLRYTEPIFVLSQIFFAVESNKMLKANLEKQKLTVLHGRIKPHYLLNSISAIRYFCKTDGVMADRLLENLSLLLRQQMQFQGVEATHPLGDELLMCRAYASIAKARFGSRVQYEEELTDIQEDVNIPSMTIQPLVENAICHGLLKSTTGGSVRVCVAMHHDMLSVSVEDSGIGLPCVDAVAPLSYDTWRKRIMATVHSTGSTTQMDEWKVQVESGIGMNNIHARLRHLGQEGLSLSMRQGGGTVVSFQLRVGKEGEDVHSIRHRGG